jgi:sec-independent protein translocase protein TatA
MPNIGPMELIIVLVIVLVIFGPKRLPGLGRQLGSGMREFKDSISSKSKDDDDGDTLHLDAAREADRTPVATTAAPATPATTPAASTTTTARPDEPAAAPRRDA